MKTIVKRLLQGRMARWGMLAGLLAGALLARAGDMVPYHSKTIGQMIITADGTAIEETGIGTHIGNFTLTGATGADGLIWFTVIAVNGDNLFGVVVGASGDTVDLLIYDGTGRFKGVTGNITVTLTMDPNPVSLDPLILVSCNMT